MSNQLYHRAKTWQLAFFALNNSATNVYMFLMMYVSYYATGVAGLGVAIVGIIGTAIRLWDGITDPIVGILIDKTNGKFGKFRPYMILGNVILAVSSLIIFGTVHLVPEGFRLVYYILAYAVYIVGYTLQTACTKAGQACLTNDPKQRPQFTLFDTIYMSVVFSVLPVITSGPLYTWAGGFNDTYFMAYTLLSIALSAIMTVLAVIGIWSHDNEKFFPKAEKAEKIGVKAYWDLLKGNRAIQMLVVSAASDKLASTVKTNSVLMVCLFGIFLGNYSLYGTTSLIVTVPSIIITMIGVQYASKKGMKKALVGFTVLDLVFSAGMIAIMLGTRMSGVAGAEMGTVLTIIFIVLYSALGCAESLSSGLVIPMLADCADYEASRSGRYMPAMIGTLFSFIDKLVSSLGTTVISLGLVAIGYESAQPAAEDPMTGGIFGFLMIMYFGLPIIGWILNLIAMKFYPLSKEKMEEVQLQIADMKASVQE